jgi:hypothetical protein
MIVLASRPLCHPLGAAQALSVARAAVAAAESRLAAVAAALHNECAAVVVVRENISLLNEMRRAQTFVCAVLAAPPADEAPDAAGADAGGLRIAIVCVSLIVSWLNLSR